MKQSELERIERVIISLRRDAENWNKIPEEYERGMACGTWRAVALIENNGLYHDDVVMED